MLEHSFEAPFVSEMEATRVRLINANKIDLPKFYDGLGF